MKRIIFTLIGILFLTLFVMAQDQQQEPPKFSPERFDAEQQQFIIKEAALTQQEAAKFFPLYREMQKKQRMLYERQRRLGNVKPADEKGCQKAIQERDNIEVELRRIQQTYHNKFFDVLPASKVYDVIQADDRFYRHMLRKWSFWGKNQKPGVNNQRPGHTNNKK